jgi:hypothetical protein
MNTPNNKKLKINLNEVQYPEQLQQLPYFLVNNNDI